MDATEQSEAVKLFVKFLDGFVKCNIVEDLICSLYAGISVHAPPIMPLVHFNDK